MDTEVSFYSGGLRLAGNLHLPDRGPSKCRAGIVLCHGLGGIKDLSLPEIAGKFEGAGYAVLRFDYRGFGESEGTRGRLIPLEQVEDIQSALTFLGEQVGVCDARLGLYGTSFGGGNAVYAAGLDKRVRCLVATVPVGNGRRWLRSLRRQWEWMAFVRELDADSKQRVLTGASRWVDSDYIMVPDPEADRWHQEVLSEFPERAYSLPLETASRILEYAPEDLASRLDAQPLLVITVSDDALVASDEQALRLFDCASQPKRLLTLQGYNHHDVYSGLALEMTMNAALGWFEEHLRSFPCRHEDGRTVSLRTAQAGGDVVVSS